MLITKKSTFTGKVHTIELPVTEQQFADWEGGMLIQEAFSNLEDWQREFLMTGVTKEEWEEEFSDNEDWD